MYTGGAAGPEAGRRQSEAWPAGPSQNFKKSGQQGRIMGIPSPEAGALASLGTRIVPSFAGETRKRDRFPQFCPADSTRRPSGGQICPKSVPRPAGQAWGGDGSAKIRPADAVTARSRDGRFGQAAGRRQSGRMPGRKAKDPRQYLSCRGPYCQISPAGLWRNDEIPPVFWAERLAPPRFPRLAFCR